MKTSIKDFSFKDIFFVSQFAKKFCCMFFGILAMGFFLSFLIKINWGTDPCTFMNKTISKSIGWTFGNWQLFLNTCFFLIVLFVNCKLIGLGTLFNWVLIGYTADFFCWVWDKTIPEQVFTSADFFSIKVVVFIASLLLFVIAASFYMNAQLGLSPYDALAYIFSDITQGIMPRFLSRIIFDIAVVGVGVIFGLILKIPIKSALPGSVAMGLTLGPAIQIVGKFVNKHILNIG